MLTFAFTTLVLAIFAAAGVLGYLYAKREFSESLRTYRRSTNAKINILTKRLDEADEQIAMVSNVAHQKQTDGKPKMNPLITMEDRHEAGLKKVVNINGENVPLQKTG
jgi:hypothetical protein